MQKFLSSKKKKENLERVQSMTPEKYGKAAFCDLTFTPSKLSENVLFKQATHMKRIEEQSSKCRQLETQNKLLSDQLEYLKRERDGIESSLNRMIEMYKQIISNMQQKNEDRLRNLHNKFKQQVKKSIADKEQQAKFIQSQKECIEQRILQLQTQVQDLQNRIAHLGKDKSQVITQLDDQKQKTKNLNRKIDDLEIQLKEFGRSSKEKYEELKYSYQQAQINWKNDFNQEVRKKNLEIQRNMKIHKDQIEKKQKQKNHENALKNQELTELKNGFQRQIKSLNQILHSKQKLIQKFNTQMTISKSNSLNVNRDYQASIATLVQQKNRLKDDLKILVIQNNELRMNTQYTLDQYAVEIERLKDLLNEKSVQMDRCQHELIRLAKDNHKLITRVKSSEDQAKAWKESYYLNKTHRQN